MLVLDAGEDPTQTLLAAKKRKLRFAKLLVESWNQAGSLDLPTYLPICMMILCPRQTAHLLTASQIQYGAGTGADGTARPTVHILRYT